ncbi:hypothetical protein [Kitasatospora indigofera]|uniref:hypothetical protein n=1 Tax=Kitasatospora indigofera TaxID=67307 RepID=UPI0033AE4BAE
MTRAVSRPPTAQQAAHRLNTALKAIGLQLPTVEADLHAQASPYQLVSLGRAPADRVLALAAWIGDRALPRVETSGTSAEEAAEQLAKVLRSIGLPLESVVPDGYPNPPGADLVSLGRASPRLVDDLAAWLKDRATP